MGSAREAPRPGGVRSAEPSDLRKTGGSCARARGGIPLEVESADLRLGLAARPPREPLVQGSQRGRGRRLWSVPGGRGPRAASRWGRGAGLRPPRPPSWSATAQPRPLSRAGARLVAALVARRGPGRCVRGSPCRRCRRRYPSKQRGPVGPPRQSAPGDGKRRGRGHRLRQSFPDVRIRARGCRPPATAPRRARRFLIWKKKSTSFPLSSSLSGRPAAGAPNLSTAAPPPAVRALENVGT